MRALPGKESRQPPGVAPVSRDAAAADQRRRILEATADLVAEHGYQETTVEMIVRAAKVGYATYYKHFPDKESAFLALLERAMDEAAERVEAAHECENGPWADRVGAALGALFDAVAANPTLSRVCLVDSLTVGPRAAGLHEAALRRLAQLLRPGRDLRVRQEGLPDSLEETLAGGVAWVLSQRLLAGEAGELRAMLPETLEFLLRPYLGEEEAAREAAKFAEERSAA